MDFLFYTPINLHIRYKYIRYKLQNDEKNFNMLFESHLLSCSFMNRVTSLFIKNYCISGMIVSFLIYNFDKNVLNIS